MHVVHQPAATARPHDVDRYDLIAARALQFHTKGPQFIVSRNKQRTFYNPVPVMIEKFLNHHQPPLHFVGVHLRAGRGAVLGSPELPHALDIIRLDRGEKPRDRFVHRLGYGSARSLVLAAGAAGQQNEHEREPSLHETGPVVGVTRR